MRSYQPGSVAPGARRTVKHPRDTPRPDPIRIAGISGTLLLNSGVFLLLLVPMARPDMLPDMREPQQTFQWITAPPTPPLPPPIEVPVVAPRSVAPTPVDVRAPVVPPVAILVDAGEPVEQVQAIVEAPAAATAVASIAPPQTGARLEYASAPPPPYPRESLMAGDEGTVLLKVVVGIDGVPTLVSIHRSSGDRRLDDAARRHVLKRWRFQPASVDGVPIEAVGIVPIEFSVDRG